MLYTCQKSDNRFTRWKIVVIYFILRLWLYVGLCPSWACFTDIRTSLLVIERCLCSTAKYRFCYLSLLLQQCAFDITPEVERREVNVPQWRCNPAGIRKHSPQHTNETFKITLSPSLLTRVVKALAMNSVFFLFR